MESSRNICATCLSSDRHLVPLHELRNMIQYICFTELNVTSDGGVCWECKSNITKFHKFKLKALRAQSAFSNNMKNEHLKSLSSLVLNVNLLYTYQYCYNSDPLINCDTAPKLEMHIAKEESEDSTSNELDHAPETDNNATETTDKIENVYVDTISGLKIKKIVKESKIAEEDLEDKFTKVVFTEGEMLQNREDKRNHYNFKKIPFKCDSCVLGFTRKETYNKHMKKKHDKSIGPHTCDICEVRFATTPAVASHRWKHYSCYRCRLCKFTTTELWSALNHCRVKHERDRLDRIHCAQCDSVAKTAQELEAHVQTEHTLYCNECGVRFKGTHTLRRHKARIHSTARQYICDVCSKTFSSKTRLESHMASHNASLAKKLSFCPVCNVQYKNIYVYRNHLKNSANHSERAFSCPECNKKFASKVYWTKHYNFYHLQKSQYNCEICKKLFISEWRLKNHRQKHHGLSRPRDHPCDICGKKFFTVSILRNHLLTHSAQRRYMCEDCGDTFKQRPALYTHAKLLHAGGRGTSRATVAQLCGLHQHV